MGKFRKRPVVIEAIRYNGFNIKELWEAFGAGDIYGPTEMTVHPFVSTLEGGMTIMPGDWVIEGVNGEHYPCKADIFAATYEPVES